MLSRSDLALVVVANLILLVVIDVTTPILAFPLSGGRNLFHYDFSHVLNANHNL